MSNTDTTTAATKPWYASKGVWGSVIAMAALAGNYFGLHIDAATQQYAVDQTTAIITNAIALAGMVLALYGRIVATKTIG